MRDAAHPERRQRVPLHALQRWLFALAWTSLVFFLLGSPLAGSLRAAELPADLIVAGGKIITANPAESHVEAMVSRHGKVVAVGSREELRHWQGPKTKVVELDGRVVMPGIIESHGHFLSVGQSLLEPSLGSARNWSEVVERIKREVGDAPPGRWIIGRGWHQEKWDAVPQPNVTGYPLHTDLSAISPNNPVLLIHASGHMAIANAEALRRARIDRNTESPSGGEILHDREGEPTGVLRETACDLVWEVYGQAHANRSEAEIDERFHEMVRRASLECLRHGVTSFHDAGSDFETIDRLRGMSRNGQISIRLWMMVRESSERLERSLADYAEIRREANDHFTVGGIKHSIDGALGSHGAWMLEPYSDLSESCGLNTTPIEEIRRAGELALKYNLQLCVHAIGDRANREVLDLYEELLATAPRGERRWRIEHAQHLHPRDIPRFAQLRVIASMQPIHCTSDAPFVIDRLGTARASQGAYAWRNLLDAGAVVISGTDAPVESIDPFACLEAAVTRRLASGDTFFPKKCMTRTEAIRSYTHDAAWAVFEDDWKGMLSPGKVADFVILSQDPETVSAEDLSEIKVFETYIGGKRVYAAPPDTTTTN